MTFSSRETGERGFAQRASPLAIPVDPRPGEGIEQLIFRAAALNSYESVSDVLLAAGLERTRANTAISAIAPEHAAALAVTLGLQEAVVMQLICRPDRERPGWSDFFGAQVRDIHRERAIRRVSPRSLAGLLRCRAVWTVRVFSFDPETRELLLEACPICHRKLGFRRSLGVQYCDHCTRIDPEGFTRGAVDLRDFPQPLVNVEDLEALDFVTGLVNPDPDVRTNFRPSLPSAFARFDRGSLFEFVVALSCALTSAKHWTSSTLHRPSTKSEYTRFRPEVLATAGRAILNWPAGFHEVAVRIRAEAAARPGHFGIKKELGPLVALSLDAHVDTEIRAIVRKAIDLDMANSASALPTVRRAENRNRSDLITIQAASMKYGVHRRALSRLAHSSKVAVERAVGAKKAPILLVEREVADLVKLRGKIVASSTVAIELGVPRMSLRGLAGYGLLKHVDEPISSLCVGDEYFLRSTVEELKDRISDVVRSDKPPAGWVRVSKAVNRLECLNGNPWPAIFEAILDRRLPVWRIAGRLTAVMTSLAVPGIGALKDVLQSQPELCWESEEVRLTQTEVTRLTGINTVVICGLMRSGLLQRAPTSSDVRRFMAEFILTSEIARRLEEFGRKVRWRDVPAVLGRAGIQPVLATRYGRGFVWPRKKVESFIYATSTSQS